ncbi:MAG: PD-(D/E)XK nuclease-like domain-containing protein [Labedaea sp.]
MTAAGTVLIDQPGVYDIPAEAYHADPVAGGSLSSTGARKLLPPSTPAQFRHWVDEGSAPSRVFDFGHAAHKLVLGAGPELAVIDAADFRTKAARAERDEAHASGQVPLLAHEHEVVVAMAEALLRHEDAAALFAVGTGHPEQTLVWQDPETGVWCRARLDWLPVLQGGRRLLLPDYKSAAHADRVAFERAMAEHGYHQQAAWYLEGARQLALTGRDAGFVFVVQEKSAPYLVNLVEPDVVALRWGAIQNECAREIYRRCSESGQWPGYRGVELAALPAYAENRIEAAYDSGEYTLEIT